MQAVTGENVEIAFVDQGYTGEQAAQEAAQHGIRLEVVKLPVAKKGFVLLPRRWVVERSFAWTTRFRRLVRDYERLPAGGQQQRVALARALAVQPSFLLLDEPFAGLDLITKARLLEEIAALATAQHVTIVLVTHDPYEATALCQSALVLDNRHVEEAGTWKELLGNPRSELLPVFRAHLK